MYERVVQLEPEKPASGPSFFSRLGAMAIVLVLSAGIALTWYRAALVPETAAPESPCAKSSGHTDLRTLILPPAGQLVADWKPELESLSHQLRVAAVRFDLGSATPRILDQVVQPVAAGQPAQIEGSVVAGFELPPEEPLPIVHRYHLPGPLHRWHDWRKREPIDYGAFCKRHIGFRLVPYVHEGRYFVRRVEGVRQSGGLRRPDEQIEPSALDTPEGSVLLVESSYEHTPRPYDVLLVAVLQPREESPATWTAEDWTTSLDETALDIIRQRERLAEAGQNGDAAGLRLALDNRTRALLRIGQVWSVPGIGQMDPRHRPSASSFDNGILMRARILAGDGTALEDETFNWHLQGTIDRMRADGVFEYGVSAAAAEMSFWSRVRLAVDEPRIANLAAEMIELGIAHDDRLRTLEGELSPDLKPEGLFERRDLKQWNWFIRGSLEASARENGLSGLSAASVPAPVPMEPPELPFLLLYLTLAACLTALWPVEIPRVPLTGVLTGLKPAAGLAAVLLGLALSANYLETHDGRLGLQVTGLAAAAIGTFVLARVSKRGMGFVPTVGFVLAAIMGASAWVTTVQNAANATALGIATLPLLALALWRPGDRGAHAPQPTMGYVVVALPCAVFFILYSRHLSRKIESPDSLWHEGEVWPLAAAVGVIGLMLVITTILNVIGDSEEEDQTPGKQLPLARRMRSPA